MLLSEPEFRRIGEAVLKAVTAEDALVRVTHSQESTARLANNAVAQNMYTEQCEVALTVAFGNRVGKAKGVSTSKDALLALVRRAEENARLAPPDPEHLPVLGPQEYLPVQAFSGDTAALTPEQVSRHCLGLIEPARASGMTASGTVEISAEAVGVLSSRGLFGFHTHTRAEAGCTIQAADSSGWARGSVTDVRDLDCGRLARTAVEQARQGAAPTEVPPGKYTVLFMPAACAYLATILVWTAEARRTLEGLTYLSNRVGRKLVGEDITLIGDPQDPVAPFTPFDEEGIPHRRTAWIDHGVFNSMWWDRWTAHANGVAPAPLSGSLRMSGTEASVDQLIGGIERGILVTHLWYVRPVKMDQTLFTGMTRDGTFLIEEGRIRGGIKNLRFNDTCLGMLQRTRAIGRPEPCVDRFPLHIFPPIVVEDWNFTGNTDF